MSRRILSVLMLLALVSSVFASNGTQIGTVGAKSTAMGSAFRGLADDWSAAYFNPAGATQFGKWEIGFSAGMIMPRGSYEAYLYPVAPFAGMKTGAVDATINFDAPTQGSPNGFAFGSDGSLYVATENPVLTCGTPGIGLGDQLAGVYRAERQGDGFGTPAPVLARFALIGDGITLDAEGNIYVIFDRFGTSGLKSGLWVLPAEGGEPVHFLTATGRLLANPAFGQGAFGETTLYIALIAIPPLTGPEAVGVERIEVGIPGLPDPPVPAS